MRWDRNINKQLWRSKSRPTGSYMIHSDTSSLFLHCEGPPFMFYILPVSVANWIQRYLLACFFNTPGLRCFWLKSFQTCHSTLPLNTRLINVAHTLIIHVKDFFLLGVSNCQEPREPLPPPLFDGRSLPLGKALLCRRWRTRSEGQETKERLGCPLWPPSNAQSSRLSHPLFHIRASSFKPVLSPLDFSLFFRPPPPPSTLQSQAFGCQWDQATARCMSVEKNGWLIQSSLLFLRQRRVISGTAKAFWCIAFMLTLAPSPLPQKSKLLWSGGGGRETSFTDSSETREGLFQRGDTQQWAAYLHRKELLSQQWGVKCQVSTSCANEEGIISVCVWVERSAQ